MKKNKTFVISDIHGGYKALLQVLKKSEINYETDTLICIGDVCDGWPEVKECFIEIMKFKNLIYILGNHDEWARDYYNTGNEDMMWYPQGGKATQESFQNNIPANILKLLNDALPYYIKDNILFVHGGFDPDIAIEKHGLQHLIWDRDLMNDAIWTEKNHLKNGKENKITKYDRVFIGHTPTLNWNDITVPMTKCEITLIDTGASYYGPLTIMNIDTNEYWQSDNVNTFYPGIKARGHHKKY
jgi:serine/threonine protein phosphatase 1